MNRVDKRILNHLQKGIPFVKRPWKELAAELNMEEGFLLGRLVDLKKRGLIRRLGASINPRKLGFISTLVAAKIKERDLGQVAKKINLYPEVSHNYRRDAEYNLWFTLVAQNNQRISRIINSLKKDERIEKIFELPATKFFKLDVNFKF